jgi:hypothetical protein
MIKYISVAADEAMWDWDTLEDAMDNLLGYGLGAGEQVFVYEVEVEPASLNDSNVFVVDEDGCVEFFKSMDEVADGFDCDIEGIYTIKKYLRTWQYKMELTERLVDGASFPLLP